MTIYYRITGKTLQDKYLKSLMNISHENSGDFDLSFGNYCGKTSGRLLLLLFKLMAFEINRVDAFTD